jgi:FMN-dependent NADH-azoreductase
MSLFRLDASIMPATSASRELADLVEEHWLAEHPAAPVVRRHLAADPLPSTAWALAVAASFTPEADRTPEQRDAHALAASLAGELQQADAALLAVPLYNFGISQHVKTWIDLAIAGAPKGSRLLEGTPTVLTVVRGGAYGEGTPREGWDHATDYLRRILSDVWGADLTIVEREFTLVGVNPELDQFTELAGSLHRRARTDAAAAGRDLARAARLDRAS